MTDRNNPSGSAAERIGQLAWNALIEEVITTPKPGLVDLYSNGAHTDMDVHTFRRSAEALRPYFVKMAQMGLQEDGSGEDLFRSIRGTGMEAEKAMFAATDGVNTHKGIIFTFGVFCAAAGRCLREGRELKPENLLRMQQMMTVRVLTAELEQLREQAAVREQREKAAREKIPRGTKGSESATHGEKISGGTEGSESATYGEKISGGTAGSESVAHGEKISGGTEGSKSATHGEKNLQRYGTAGIRGEAIAGYPGVFLIGLPVLRDGLARGEDWNRVKLQTLVSLMAQTEDSNILSRGGMEELERVHAEMKTFLETGGAYRQDAEDVLKAMDADYIRRNCSPGGCADLLAAAVFIYDLGNPEKR